MITLIRLLMLRGVALMLNVLSIDWDYFIDADGKWRYDHFPDIPNEDYAQSLQYAIWASRYAEDKELIKIGINPLAYDIAYLLEDMDDIPYIVVCDSHKYAYTFTVQRLKETGNKQVNLLNIDFHSDCRDNLKKLDCGNWLSVLMSEYRGKWHWLGWKDSYKAHKPRKLKFLSEFHSFMIMETAWDLVFICRSNMWSPPHLDKDFTDVFQPVVDGRDGQVQKGIWDSRYDRLLPDIETLEKSLNDWKKQNGRK